MTDRDSKLRDIYGDPEDEWREIKREMLRAEFDHQLSKRRTTEPETP